MQEIVAGQAVTYEVEAEFEYEVGCPPTINHPEQAAFAVDIAKEISCEDMVDPDRGKNWALRIFPICLRPAPALTCF